MDSESIDIDYLSVSYDPDATPECQWTFQIHDYNGSVLLSDEQVDELVGFVEWVNRMKDRVAMGEMKQMILDYTVEMKEGLRDSENDV